MVNFCGNCYGEMVKDPDGPVTPADVEEAEERKAYLLSLLTARAVELFCRYSDDPAIASKTRMPADLRSELIEVLEECEAKLGRYNDVTQALWRVLLAFSVRRDFGSANPQFEKQFEKSGGPIDHAAEESHDDQSLADLLVTAVADAGVWLRLWGEAEKYVARCRGGKAVGP